MNIRSKKIIYLSFVGILFGACSSNTSELEKVEQNESLEIIQTSFRMEMGGLLDQTQITIEHSLTSGLDDLKCDSTYNKEVEESFLFNEGTAAVNGVLRYTMECGDFDSPEQIRFYLATGKRCENPRISSEEIASFKGGITGLDLGEDEWIFQGSYSSSATSQLLVKAKKWVDTKIQWTLTEIRINKHTGEIQSGLGSYHLEGDISGSTFSKSGNIEIREDGTAILVVDGTSFIIDWK